MNYSELENWILKQGGPSFYLRAYEKGRVKLNNNEALSRLLELDEVNKALDFLDAFNTQSRDKKTLEHLIHYYKESCIDNFFSKILSLGFKAGIPIFDIKLQPAIKLFIDLLSEDKDYAYYYTLMLHRFS
jgi:hypothetical protein